MQRGISLGMSVLARLVGSIEYPNPFINNLEPVSVSAYVYALSLPISWRVLTAALTMHSKSPCIVSVCLLTS